MEFELNQDAGYEDAHIYIAAIGHIWKEQIIFPLTEKERDLIWQEIEKIKPEEIFNRMLSGFNLAPIQGKWLSKYISEDLKKELLFDSRLPAINLTAVIQYVFAQSYLYAAGAWKQEERPDRDTLISFTNFANTYTRFSALQNKRQQIIRPGRIIEDSALKEVSPRYAYAVSLFSARHHFETALNFATISPEPTIGTISPRVLRTLAGVTNGYIMELIKSGKLPAEKLEQGVWGIPATEALNWLRSRKNCAEWIKRIRI